MSEQQIQKIQSETNLIDELSSIKREAFGYLNEALTNDSNTKTNNRMMTIVLYEKSIQLIDKGLKCFEKNKNQLEKNEDAVKINTQLSRMKTQANERLNYLNSSSKENNKNYQDEFIEIGDDILEDDYDVVSNQDKNQPGAQTHQPNTSTQDNSFSKASELMSIANGAQIYYIANDGSVSTPSYPTTLHIYSFDRNESDRSNKVVAFIKVGTWVYPLVPHESPAMKTNFDSYIFPNDNEEANNLQPKSSFIGIKFDTNVSTEQKLFFEDVLENYGALIFQETPLPDAKRPLEQPRQGASTLTASSSAEPLKKQMKMSDENEKNKEVAVTVNESTAEYLSKQILNGAQYLSKGVEMTTEYASRYMHQGGQQIKSKLEPNAQPSTVSPQVQSLLKNVNYGTHISVRVSSYLVNKLGSIATATAKKVAPHIRQGSKALLAKSGLASDESTANSYVDNVCTVTGSSVQGFAMVYDSLEQGAKTLAKNFAEHTVNVVDYKYGTEAAKATQNTLQSTINLGLTASNIRGMKVTRTLLKATAKETLSSTNENEKLNQELTNKASK